MISKFVSHQVDFICRIVHNRQMRLVVQQNVTNFMCEQHRLLNLSNGYAIVVFGIRRIRWCDGLAIGKGQVSIQFSNKVNFNVTLGRSPIIAMAK